MVEAILVGGERIEFQSQTTVENSFNRLEEVIWRRRYAGGSHRPDSPA
jgi:hypothetical protein